MRSAKLTVVIVIALTLTAYALAEVKLPALVSDNMVLQQQTECNIWGWADPGEKVNVKASWQWFFGKSTTAGSDGKWKLSIKTPKASNAPRTITIKAANTIKLENILIGEVWVGSGQSNMEMPLTSVSNAYTGIKDSAKEIAAANYPEIRLFQVGNFSSKEPLYNVKPGIKMYGVPPAACKWQSCTPETIPTFSSTAYFFARKLHKELGVPVGIIDSSWGGTSAEVWTPAAGLKALGYHDELQQATDSPQKAGKKIPTRLYNGMIHPLRNFRIKGVIWYQGEGNSWRANKYRELFSTMIGQWRDVFGYEFPFYYVQIAPYNYGEVNSALLREAQFMTLSTPNVGMAVTMDIGNLTDIHPKNKQEVGRRLALWALSKDYARKTIVYSGPIYKNMTIEGDKIRLTFDCTGSGLIAKDGPLTHFTIAGQDKNFVPATATIENDTIVVSSKKVPAPKAVRFAFTNTAEPNLFNKEALPASSFRTDNW